MKKLRSIHTIFRKDDKGKIVSVEPGTEFVCGADEAEDYLRLKAATLVSSEPEKPAKAKPVKAKAEKPVEVEAEAAEQTDADLLG